ncbi:hypothetical protein CSIV_15500 [Microbacterium sp. CSI-V]|nr:hypothetical protein CSIV_15500 [Microbacterium sp. CSI-V]
MPWAERPVGFIALIALGALLVGVGKELAIRGILLTALRGRHGKTVTLLGAAAVFGLIHIPGSFINRAPVAFIVIQVLGIALAGVTYYWIRRVTGRLWVGMLVHAFTDFVLYLGAAEVSTASVPNDHAGAIYESILAPVQIVLWILLTASIVSVIREDRRPSAEMPSSGGPRHREALLGTHPNEGATYFANDSTSLVL